MVFVECDDFRLKGEGVILSKAIRRVKDFGWRVVQHVSIEMAFVMPFSYNSLFVVCVDILRDFFGHFKVLLSAASLKSPTLVTVGDFFLGSNVG